MSFFFALSSAVRAAGGGRSAHYLPTADGVEFEDSLSVGTALHRTGSSRSLGSEESPPVDDAFLRLAAGVPPEDPSPDSSSFSEVSPGGRGGRLGVHERVGRLLLRAGGRGFVARLLGEVLAAAGADSEAPTAARPSSPVSAEH